MVNVKELEDQFISLLDIYEVDEHGIPLGDALQDDWSIFNLPSREKTHDLLLAIFDGSDERYAELIASPVTMMVPSETEDLIDNWESFKREIKEENRFFIKNPADLESIEEVLPVRQYSKGKIFYRSRIADDETGYPNNRMGKPPRKFAKGGRGNPQGIPYLYLSQSVDTTMYEARATYLDYVAIGTFRLQEKITVITLRTSYQISPFLDEFSLEKYVRSKKFIDVLENELATPLRRQDDELDYLPTQYLCEYIKHLGYDGVEFGSSLHENGINLVIFNDSKISCIESKVYEVSSIAIEHHSLDRRTLGI
ncbi:MAG: RES family NAD+ phosphorylase [Bacteroidota bacterium]